MVVLLNKREPAITHNGVKEVLNSVLTLVSKNVIEHS